MPHVTPSLRPPPRGIKSHLVLSVINSAVGRITAQSLCKALTVRPLGIHSWEPAASSISPAQGSVPVRPSVQVSPSPKGTLHGFGTQRALPDEAGAPLGGKAVWAAAWGRVLPAGISPGGAEVTDVGWRGLTASQREALNCQETRVGKIDIT